MRWMRSVTYTVYENSICVIGQLWEMFSSPYKFPNDQKLRSKKRKLQSLVQRYTDYQISQKALLLQGHHDQNGHNDSDSSDTDRNSERSDSSDSDENNDGEDNNIRKSRRGKKSAFEASLSGMNKSTWVYNAFVVQKNGYELLPDINPTLKKNQYGVPLVGKLNNAKQFESNSFARSHLALLNNLLHGMILKQNWIAAYRIFSLLMKLYISKPKFVKFNVLWPIGLLILQKLEEKEFKNSLEQLVLQTKEKKQFSSVPMVYNNPLSVNPKAMSKLPVDKNRLKQFLDEERLAVLNKKSDKFLQWLVSFNTHMNARSKKYRLSSLIIALFLWNYVTSISAYDNTFLRNVNKHSYTMMEQLFKKINNHISDFLLQSSFNQDPIYRYIELLVTFLEFRFLVVNYKRNSEVRVNTAKIEPMMKKFTELRNELENNPEFMFDHDKLDREYNRLHRYYLAEDESYSDTALAGNSNSSREVSDSETSSLSTNKDFKTVKKPQQQQQSHQQQQAQHQPSALSSASASVPLASDAVTADISRRSANLTSVFESDDSDETEGDENDDNDFRKKGQASKKRNRAGFDSSDDSDNNFDGNTGGGFNYAESEEARLDRDIDMLLQDNEIRNDQLDDFFSQRRYSFNMFS